MKFFCCKLGIHPHILTSNSPLVCHPPLGLDSQDYLTEYECYCYDNEFFSDLNRLKRQTGNCNMIVQ